MEKANRTRSPEAEEEHSEKEGQKPKLDQFGEVEDAPVEVNASSELDKVEAGYQFKVEQLAVTAFSVFQGKELFAQVVAKLAKNMLQKTIQWLTSSKDSGSWRSCWRQLLCR